MKKIIFTFLFIYVLCLFILISYAAVDSSHVQSDAFDKFQELVTTQFNITRSSDKYPDYYGGSYINDDNKLVIYITGDFENIPSFLSDDDSIILEHAEYSYNELLDLSNFLGKQAWGNTRNSLPFEIYCIYLADSENRIVVEMSDDSAENIQLFKNVICGSPMIRFSKGSPITNLDESSAPSLVHVNNSFTLGAGVEINNSGGSSIGYRCRRNRANYFETKSHGTVRNGSAVSEGDNFQIF